MRQRRNFDAHVLEYAALKIPALPFQAEKRVFCKFAQHQPSPSLRSGESRKATPRPAFDEGRRKAERQKGRKTGRVLFWVTASKKVEEARAGKGLVVAENKRYFSVTTRVSDCWLKRNRIQSGSVLWHLRVAEGDHLSERSEGGKLPQRKTRALATLRKLKAFLGGASGGMQGGPRRGRSPITGPTLPHAAQASQLRRGRIPVPAGQKNQRMLPRRAGEIARRAGVPTSPGGESPCPQGRKKSKNHPRRKGGTPLPTAHPARKAQASTHQGY